MQPLLQSTSASRVTKVATARGRAVGWGVWGRRPAELHILTFAAGETSPPFKHRGRSPSRTARAAGRGGAQRTNVPGKSLGHELGAGASSFSFSLFLSFFLTWRA